MAQTFKTKRRATVLLMVVGILAMLFVLLSGYLALARYDRRTQDLVHRGDVVDQIVTQTNEFIFSEVAKQWFDAESGLIDPGRGLYADIPGYGPAAWQASLEPVYAWEPSASAEFDARYDSSELVIDRLRPLRYPALTSLEDSRAPRNVRLLALLRNVSTDATGDRVDLDDLNANARVPTNDALGTGVPNAIALNVATVARTANAIAGVASPELPQDLSEALDGEEPPTEQVIYNTTDLPAVLSTIPGAVDRLAVKREAADRYFAQVRYEPAVAIRPHGGMISLQDTADAASGSEHWLAEQMFGWLMGGDSFIANTKGGLYDDLDENASAVEAVLRSRGELLPMTAVRRLRDGEGVAEPPVLTKLEDDSIYWRAFAHSSRVPGLRGERVNLASTASDVENWLSMATIDAYAYNENAGNTGSQAAVDGYDFRHLLTMYSFSSDIARRLAEKAPVLTTGGSVRATDKTGLGLNVGQLKYHLGDIEKAFVSPAAATATNPAFFFDRTALPPTASTVYGSSYTVGQLQVRRLMDYYYDMLSGHDLTGEPITAVQQAAMLAVNTVGFAAPYFNETTYGYGPGYIDPVSFTFDSVTYYAYEPQLFITQVALYRIIEVEQGGSSGSEVWKCELAVELYNPYDRPLNLEQYALEIGADRFLLRGNVTDGLGGTPLHAADAELPAGERLTVIVDYESGLSYSSAFVSHASGARIVTGGLTNVTEETGEFNVRLYRRGGNPAGADYVHYCVDETVFSVGSINSIVGLHFFTGANPDDKYYEQYDTIFRDTNTSDWQSASGSFVASSWPAVIAIPQRTGNTDDDSFTDSLNGSPVNTLAGVPMGGSVGTKMESVFASGPFVGSGAKCPDVPLYMMNPTGAYNGTNHEHEVFNGVARPDAFPTVGFLAYVPRYSHTSGVTVGNTSSVLCVPETLAAVIEKKGWKPLGTGDVPVDFGHMPFFDNSIPAASPATPTGPKGVFDDERYGRVPWGQLIFDYFTTVNPDSGVDPYQIPGRININAAPWYVLAGAPLVNPAEPISPVGSSPAKLDRIGAAPAFWDETAGVLLSASATAERSLVGRQFDDAMSAATPVAYALNEHPKLQVHNWSGPGGDVYRLGAQLAQAACAYRDRLAYYSNTVGGADRYWNAEKRDVSLYRKETTGTTLAEYTVRDKYVDTSTSNEFPFYGFLTLGELLNVTGFDSTRYKNTPSATNPACEDVLAPTGTSVLEQGDYMKAVSLLALLDSHYLTTNGNTFTAYVTLFDRENPNASVRSQVTFDRSNLQPRLLTESYDLNGDGVNDFRQEAVEQTAAGVYAPVVIDNSNQPPQILSERRGGYFNTRFDY